MRNTSLCYIEHNGSYLMLHRVKKEIDENKDKWIGIGGKFEEGESPEECVLREVYEETGIHLDSPEFRGIVTFVSDEWGTEYMHLFTASVSSENYRYLSSVDFLPECQEGTLEWVCIPDVRNLPLWEGDMIFLDLLENNHPFFSLKLKYSGDILVYAALNGTPLSLPYSEKHI